MTTSNDIFKRKDGTRLRRIEVDQISVGMFVEDLYAHNGALLMNAGSIITTSEQISQLRRRGVETLLINLSRGSDLDERFISTATVTTAETEEFDTAPKKEAISQQQTLTRLREEAYFAELDRAKAAHERAMHTTVDALKNIRNGGTFSPKEMRLAALEMTDSIIRNPDALLSLSQIRGYDEYTYVHSLNVGILVAALAHALGHSHDVITEIGMGGLLHDIGKMRISEKILHKPSPLTDAEFALMKRHPEFGYEIISAKAGITDLSKKLVLQHHERFNGSGYPFGLKGERISEAGLIGAVADVYDALTAERIYKKAWTPQRALALIFKGAENEYSQRVVEFFTKNLGIYPVGSFIRLATGEMGVVLRTDRGNLLSPTILVLYDELGHRKARPEEYDLSEKLTQSDGDRYRIEISLDPEPYGINIADFIGLRTIIS